MSGRPTLEKWCGKLAEQGPDRVTEQHGARRIADITQSCAEIDGGKQVLS
jgi:hypothetical protein